MSVRFSVIVPVYGVESYISRCIDSILMQSFTNFELILVDDGSPDKSGEICDLYALKDSRVHVIHKDNAGAATARNVALKKAVGDFVIFVDGDDFLLSNLALGNVSEALQNEDIDVLVVAHQKYWDGDPLPLPRAKYPQARHAIDWMIPREKYLNAPWDKIVRRQLLLEASLEFPPLRTSDDAVWCSELLLHTDKICYVAIPFYAYLQRSGSITASFPPSKIKDLQHIFSTASRTLETCADNSRRRAYGAYFARFFSYLMAATAHEPSVENMEFLHEHRHILREGVGTRAVVTRISVFLLGVRQASLAAKFIQDHIHRRRARA